MAVGDQIGPHQVGVNLTTLIVSAGHMTNGTFSIDAVYSLHEIILETGFRKSKRFRNVKPCTNIEENNILVEVGTYGQLRCLKESDAAATIELIERTYTHCTVQRVTGHDQNVTMYVIGEMDATHSGTDEQIVTLDLLPISRVSTAQTAYTGSMSELSFWTLRRERRARQTRTFEDPAFPGFRKTITFHRVSPAERLAAWAETDELVERHLKRGEPWIGGDQEPEGMTEEGIRTACVMRWHQPEGTDEHGKPLRWPILEWIGLVSFWDTGMWQVNAFAAEMDRTVPDPLAPRTGDSSGGVPPASTRENESEPTHSPEAVREPCGV